MNIQKAGGFLLFAALVVSFQLAARYLPHHSWWWAASLCCAVLCFAFGIVHICALGANFLSAKLDSSYFPLEGGMCLWQKMVIVMGSFALAIAAYGDYRALISVDALLLACTAARLLQWGFSGREHLNAFRMNA